VVPECLLLLQRLFIQGVLDGEEHVPLATLAVASLHDHVLLAFSLEIDRLEHSSPLRGL
jgi:hypothetical protein